MFTIVVRNEKTRTTVLVEQRKRLRDIAKLLEKLGNRRERKRVSRRKKPSQTPWWTDYADAFIRQHYLNDMTAVQIAEHITARSHFVITHNMVIRRWHTLKGTKRKRRAPSTLKTS